MSNVPRYLWPLDHQRKGQPFNDPIPDFSGHITAEMVQKAFEEIAQEFFTFRRGDKVSFRHWNNSEVVICGEILTVGTLLEGEEKMALVQEFGSDRAFNVYVSRLTKLV